MSMECYIHLRPFIVKCYGPQFHSLRLLLGRSNLLIFYRIKNMQANINGIDNHIVDHIRQSSCQHTLRCIFTKGASLVLDEQLNHVQFRNKLRSLFTMAVLHCHPTSSLPHSLIANRWTVGICV